MPEEGREGGSEGEGGREGGRERQGGSEGEGRNEGWSIPVTHVTITSLWSCTGVRGQSYDYYRSQPVQKLVGHTLSGSNDL